MDRIGRELLVQNKYEILNSKATSAKQDFRKRDLLTCLMRANMADDLPEHQRMSDDDVLARKSNHFNKTVPPPVLTVL